MSVVGFDFGNDWCRVGVVRRGAVEVLQNDIGNRNTAAMVAFTRKQRLIGDSAPPQYKSNYVNTVTHLKRIIGRTLEEIRDSELPLLPYHVLSGPYGPIVEVSYRDVKEKITTQHATAALLGSLKKTAEHGLGQGVKDCVIGVPPYWSEAQRLALLDAAQVAGLNARLLNETTAIALNYGMLRPLPTDVTVNVLFVDVGACSTNAAVVAFQQGKLQVLATASDPALGGRNFDNVLVDHFAKYVMEKYKLPVLQNMKATMKLRDECLRIKKVLTANSKVNFRVEYIMNDRDVEGEIDRTQFETLAAPLLKRLMLPIESALKLSKLKKEDITSLEIVGGATRIPMVKRAFSEWFGRSVSQTCDADESVARGCALQCAILSPAVRVKPFEVIDIGTEEIHLKWGENGKFEEPATLFPFPTSLGATKAVSLKARSQPLEFLAFGRNQTILGQWTITGNPEPTKGAKAPKLKVTVKLDQNSIVTIPSAEWSEVFEVVEAPETKEQPKDQPQGEQPKDQPQGEQPKDQPQGEQPKDQPEAAKTEEGKEKKAEEKKVSQQKRTVDLSVTETKPGRMPQQLIQDISKREKEMIATDKLVIETSEARNLLESYVLDTKSSLTGSLEPFVEKAVREKYLEELNATELWLEDHDDSVTKEEFQSRLAKLKVVGDAAHQRRNEAETRPEAIARFEKAIAASKAWAESKDDAYSHIKEEERKKVLDNCAQAKEWFKELHDKQSKLQTWDDPVLTSDALEKKAVLVENFAKSVMSEPKPKPQPTPTADAAQNKASDSQPPEQKAEQAKPDQAKPEAKAEQAKPEQAKAEEQPKPEAKADKGKQGKAEQSKPDQKGEQPQKKTGQDDDRQAEKKRKAQKQ